MRSRESGDVIIVEPEGSSRAGWFLLGAALGAGLALLFAPASGEETRRTLGRQARRLKASAEDALDDLKEQFDSFREAEEETGEEAKSDVVHASRALGTEEGAPEPEAAPARPRRAAAASAREELERRLAEARARRREPQPEEEEPVA